jgi:uracil-DNA glycosylase family 4
MLEIKTLVPACGPKDAKIVFVGEAPGETEERERIPFVGSSGKLLTSLMQTVGISRTNCYITNVIKERPPGNDVSVFIDLKSGNETPAYIRYEAELKEELLALKPNVVVAVGGVALHALCRRKGITNWRGSIIESTLIPGLKVIPIIHPASALRNYIFQHYVVNDLLRVRDESQTPDLPKLTYNIHIGRTVSEITKYLERCVAAGMVGFDIEVIDGELDCLAIAISATEAMCIPFMQGSNEFWSIEDEVTVLQLVGSLLENVAVAKVMQYANFDSYFMFEHYGITTKNIEDTMIAQAILTPDFDKGLDFITSIYTKQPYYKQEGKQWLRNQLGTQEVFWNYNALDSLMCMDAFPKQLKDLESLGCKQTYLNQRKLIEPLMYMQAHGIMFDREAIAKESERVAIEIEELKKILTQKVGRDINANSPKQLSAYFYDELQLKPYTKKGGQRTTDETAMRRIARKNIPEATIIVKIRKAVKMRGTYLEAKTDPDGRMRSSYNPVGANTGRLSSSKTIHGTGTNLQNQPHEMDKFMLVDPGMVAYNLDLSGADSRVVAYCGPVPALADAYDRNVDVHRLTASALFNVPFSQVSREKGSAPQFGDGTESQRYWGKKTNHSCNYGIGPNTLADNLDCTVKEAKFFIQTYFSLYPEVRSCYQEQIRQCLQRDRVVTNPFGRKRMFMDRWGEQLFCAAYGWFGQSTVADITNQWGINYIYNDPQFEHVELVNQVHDSLIIQIPLSQPWTYHAACISKLMKSLAQKVTWKSREFSIPAEVKMSSMRYSDFEDVIINPDDPYLAYTLELNYHAPRCISWYADLADES